MFRLAFAIAMASFILPVRAEEPIRFHYNERPPYLITADEGIVYGLTGTPASLALQQSGIPHIWLNTPAKRQMALLKQNKGKDCLVGWFKNADRETFSRYTHAIYQDKPSIGLALRSNADIKDGHPLQEVMKNPDLTILTKIGYSYGRYIDNLLEQIKPVRQNVPVENLNMMRMLEVGRGDYFFVAEEEADELIRLSKLPGSLYQFIRFSDVPPGDKRYILCSLQVEPEIIAQLNQWIDQHINIQ